MRDVLEKRKKELNKAKEKLIGLDNRPPDSHYSINVTLSDYTSLDRDLPDTRPKICSSIKYDTLSLPRCTVIIPFFNEAPTMILRAVHSVLNRSPAHLLDEIILGKSLCQSLNDVSNCSVFPGRKYLLVFYVQFLEKSLIYLRVRRSIGQCKLQLGYKTTYYNHNQ
jgi:hypothetical protein